jgi:hypothetical protein
LLINNLSDSNSKIVDKMSGFVFCLFPSPFSFFIFYFDLLRIFFAFLLYLLIAFVYSFFFFPYIFVCGVLPAISLLHSFFHHFFVFFFKFVLFLSLLPTFFRIFCLCLTFLLFLSIAVINCSLFLSRGCQRLCQHPFYNAHVKYISYLVISSSSH